MKACATHATEVNSGFQANHSCRSATSGSTRAARAAGT